MRPSTQNLTAVTLTNGARLARRKKAIKPCDPKPGKLPEQWWRIEVNGDGKVVSCEPVELVGNNDDLVFFVSAKTRARAGRLAFNAYCCARQRKQRSKLVAEGKCAWCGKKNDRAKGRCTVCQEKDAAYGREARARARGEDVPERVRSVAVAARAHEERKAIRLGVLNEVREAWVRADDYDQFARWLASEIVSAGGGEKLERAS